MSERGFKQFLVSQAFLYHYPKNAEFLATHFHICENRAQSDLRWVIRAAVLKKIKITLPNNINDEDAPIYAASVDGADLKRWEVKYPTLNKDPAYFSKKFNGGGVKFEIALSVSEQRIIWCRGPFKASKHDYRWC